MSVARPIVCTIGTTDPWNAAGLGLDVRALHECGARAVTVVVAVSAQDKGGICALAPLPAAIVRAQFESLQSAQIAVYRIGALPGAESAALVAAGIPQRAPVVWDPVFAASGGGAFFPATERARLIDTLLPRATIVTPNIAEAEGMTGLAPLDNFAALEEAARALVGRGAGAALIKGGHLAGRALDVLFDGALQQFEDARLPGTMRGTGCLLADALAAALARGCSLPAAVAEARAYVRRKLVSAEYVSGMRLAD